MTVAVTRDDLDDFAELGMQVFARTVRPALRPEDDGKFVAVDVDSGQFEIDGDDYAAVTRLHARLPAARVWLTRAGHPAAYRMRRGR